MAISIKFLLKGTAWSLGSFAIGQGVRLVTSIILARLLSPQLFGIFQIINALRTGLALVSDFGVAQNIVYSPNANVADFYNTAWTMEIIRTSTLWLFCLLAAIPISHFYNYPQLSYLLPIAALSLIISGLSSPGRYLLQKGLRVAELSTMDVIVAFLSSLALITAAVVTKSVWALVIGGLFASAVTSAGTFFLRSGVHHRLRLVRRYVIEIIGFGKWVFLISILYFLSQNYDRLYLAKLIPLDLLGIYGIARGICDLLNTIILRMGNLVLFPFITSHSKTPRPELRDGLRKIRAQFLMIASLGFSVIISMSDILIRFLYDERYHAAAWMLPALLVGSWFALMAGVNEATLLGLVGPRYNLFSNGFKVAFMVVALQPSFSAWGPVGVIAVIAASDVCRYIPTSVGQRLERFSFLGQDLLFTAGVAGLVAIFEGLRWSLGFGTSFDSLLLQW